MLACQPVEVLAKVETAGAAGRRYVIPVFRKEIKIIEMPVGPGLLDEAVKRFSVGLRRAGNVVPPAVQQAVIFADRGAESIVDLGVDLVQVACALAVNLLGGEACIAVAGCKKQQKGAQHCGCAQKFLHKGSFPSIGAVSGPGRGGGRCSRWVPVPAAALPHPSF